MPTLQSIPGVLNRISAALAQLENLGTGDIAPILDQIESMVSQLESGGGTVPALRAMEQFASAVSPLTGTLPAGVEQGILNTIGRIASRGEASGTHVTPPGVAEDITGALTGLTRLTGQKYDLPQNVLRSIYEGPSPEGRMAGKTTLPQLVSRTRAAGQLAETTGELGGTGNLQQQIAQVLENPGLVATAAPGVFGLGGALSQYTGEVPVPSEEFFNRLQAGIESGAFTPETLARLYQGLYSTLAQLTGRSFFPGV